MYDQDTQRNDRTRYFDWFILAGLAMNVLIVMLLVGIWIFH